jgi:hypothetical protein
MVPSDAVVLVCILAAATNDVFWQCLPIIRGNPWRPIAFSPDSEIAPRTRPNLFAWSMMSATVQANFGIEV